MMTKQRRILLIVAALLLVVTAGTAVLAQTSASFTLERYVVDSGGGAASSASYRVAGSAGQGVAGPTASSASFVVSSGFWIAESGRLLYLPAVTEK